MVHAHDALEDRADEAHRPQIAGPPTAYPGLIPSARPALEIPTSATGKPPRREPPRPLDRLVAGRAAGCYPSSATRRGGRAYHGSAEGDPGECLFLRRVVPER
jgi:hypothetical protein